MIINVTIDIQEYNKLLEENKELRENNKQLKHQFLESCKSSNALATRQQMIIENQKRYIERLQKLVI